MEFPSSYRHLSVWIFALLALCQFLSDDTLVNRLSKLHVTKEQDKNASVSSGGTNLKDEMTRTKRWIHVLEWGEGMSAWLISLTEVLLAARRAINASYSCRTLCPRR